MIRVIPFEDRDSVDSDARALDHRDRDRDESAMVDANTKMKPDLDSSLQLP